MNRLLLFAFTALTSFAAAGAEPAPVITYQWLGGMAVVSQSEVTIDGAGNVAVACQHRRRGQIRYSSKLSPEEITGLAKAIQTTDFFSVVLDRSRPVPTDMGRSTLTIAYQGKKRTLEWQWMPELDPLESYFKKLVHQADLADAVDHKERFYEVLGAIDSHLAAQKVLQPYVFKPKIIASLSNEASLSDLNRRLQALSCLTTPEEFAGTIAKALPEPRTKEWRIWLATLSDAGCYGNFQTKEYLPALFPLFTEQIRNYGIPTLPSEVPERHIFHHIRKLFADQHYDAGLPPE